MTESLFSLRAYAKHRGCHLNAVQRAIASERIRQAVVRVDGVPKITDFALADREWSDNTDSAKVPLAVQLRDEERRRQPPGAAPFSVVTVPDLGLVELYFSPADEEEEGEAFAVGLEPSVALWLGERLIAAARRTPVVSERGHG
jgi:hypothetical protein